MSRLERDRAASLEASKASQAQAKRENAKHTPGPWRWEFNAEHKSVHLCGGRPMFDLTVMDFYRWGMGGAVPRFRDTAEDGMNLMDRLCDKVEWIAPEPGREHHKSWHQLVTHPDARLMAAAPDLLAALQEMYEAASDSDSSHYGTLSTTFLRKIARAAIAKATGETT